MDKKKRGNSPMGRGISMLRETGRQGGGGHWGGRISMMGTRVDILFPSNAGSPS